MRFSGPISLLLFLGGLITAQGKAEDAPSPLVSVVVRTTAYTHTEDDHLPYGNNSALGTVLTYTPEYHSVPADRSRFPRGPKFMIKCYTRLFYGDAYGSSTTHTQTIALFFPTKERISRIFQGAGLKMFIEKFLNPTQQIQKVLQNPLKLFGGGAKPDEIRDQQSEFRD